MARCLLRFAAIVCLFLSSAVVAAKKPKISRIVVLMEENRSFDHLMGWYNKSVNGLKSTDCNLANVTNSSSQKVCPGKTSPYVNFCDPDHTFPATSFKIYGPTNYKDHNYTTAEMSGFVEWEKDQNHITRESLEFCGVMDSFTPERLPVLTALADNFVSFDKFFCSHPGPTWPNRLFALSGTSAGQVETIPWYHDKVGHLYPQKTIFDQVAEAGGTWKYYYDDSPWELFLESLAHAPENTFQMDTFYQDAKEGTLPHFSFMNPRAGLNITSGQGSNDMHPDHDVALSELLYKDVYEALRAGPQWNETLFILTWDEHGGFHDHVAPPNPVPSPGDNETSYPFDFNFTRSGIRIPTLLASPWLPKETILTDPPADQMPTSTSNYELTSIMATVRKLLPFMKDTPPLTKRDAWAATFEHLFDQLEEPRTDCPMTLPDAPAPTKGHLEYEANDKVNGLQEFIMTVNAHLAGVSYPHHITQQKEVAEWNQEHHLVHRARTLAWKDSKKDDSKKYEVEIMPVGDPARPFVKRTWRWSRNVTVPNVETFSVAINGTRYCLDSAEIKPLSLIGLSYCYPTHNPGNNRDKAQQWVYKGDDHSIRPTSAQWLCLTNHIFGGSNNLRLEVCGDPLSLLSQHYVYHGGASEEGGDTVLGVGDPYYEIRVMNKK